METPISPFTPTPEPIQKIEFFEQYRFWILGVFIIIMGIGIYLILTPPTETLAVTGDNVFIADESENIPINSDIVVDISGGVNNPGVYKLAINSIVEDAIDLSLIHIYEP